MWLSRPLLASTMAFALVLGGCAGDVASQDSKTMEEADDGQGPSSQTFDRGGWPFTFQVPADATVTEEVSLESQVNAPTDQVGIMLSGPHDIIVLQAYELNTEVTVDNLGAAAAGLNRHIEQLDPGFEVFEGEIAGLPALRYSFRITSPTEATSEVLVLYDGQQEYLINCQDSPTGGTDVAEACAMLVATITPRG